MTLNFSESQKWAQVWTVKPDDGQFSATADHWRQFQIFEWKKGVARSLTNRLSSTFVAIPYVAAFGSVVTGRKRTYQRRRRDPLLSGQDRAYSLGLWRAISWCKGEKASIEIFCLGTRYI